jgi:signal transduction histidine kinase
MIRKVLAASTAVIIAGSAAVAVPLAVQAETGHRSGYEPMLNPADFVTKITNPYFPLPVGRTLIYRGTKDGKTQIDRVHVTARTRVLEGITATAVTDVSTHGRKLLEKTTDWYAQDKKGNVWYLGERTAAFGPGGRIDRSGSWLAVAGALRPVERMRRQATDITASDPGRRLSAPAGRDEIALLGATLNQMLDRIEASVDRERRLVDRASHELRTPLAIQRIGPDLALSGPRRSRS